MPLLRCLPVVFLALLSACQPAPRQAAKATEPWPDFDYAAAAEGGAAVFILDTGNSSIDVIARRDGPMARFGHDHVITVQSAEGFLLLDPELGSARAELRFDTRRMMVDDAGKRAAFGLDTEPDEQAVAATRRNMLEKVLDADLWPDIRLSLSGFRAEQEGYSALLHIQVRGASVSSREHFHMSRPEHGLIISGKTELLQTALGLEPFSALGGGLRVADKLEIHYRLTATLPE